MFPLSTFSDCLLRCIPHIYSTLHKCGSAVLPYVFEEKPNILDADIQGRVRAIIVFIAFIEERPDRYSNLLPWGSIEVVLEASNPFPSLLLLVQ